MTTRPSRAEHNRCGPGWPPAARTPTPGWTVLHPEPPGAGAGEGQVAESHPGMDLPA